MNLWDIWKTEAKDYVYGQLDSSQVPGDMTIGPVIKDKHYVTVNLRRMRIVNSRIGTKKFYAAVHSDIGLWHDSGRFVNFKQLISPPELKGVEADDLDRAIVTNQPLVGPTPYRGNPLQLNVALVSVRFSEFAGPFLEVLSGLASAAGVSFISVAHPFLKPLAAGIDLLAGISGSTMREVQVVTNLAPLNTGAFVTLRAPTDQLKLSDLRLGEDYALYYSDGAAVSNFPYVVCSIESSISRDDWKGIPEIKAAYDHVAAAVRNDKPKEYQDSFTVFRLAAQLSDDLLFDHANALVSQVRAKMDALMGAPLTAGGKQKEVPSLDDFNPFQD
jgi:hypothetical protein